MRAATIEADLTEDGAIFETPSEPLSRFYRADLTGDMDPCPPPRPAIGMMPRPSSECTLLFADLTAPEDDDLPAFPAHKRTGTSCGDSIMIYSDLTKVSLTGRARTRSEMLVSDDAPLFTDLAQVRLSFCY